ncbi:MULTISPECIES: hypothetical protein [unclassified Mesorhizobium]|uniref:hypothetical protein n=1 Tax=unclassified Mesorhizobium TaxID=325217 RepID=UPI0011805A0E|nr:MULTISPECIES: hypothetical protein [unclassified Mesorhizobium]
MPNFRFETVVAGRSHITVQNLASVDLASPKALELARAAASSAPADADHSGSHVNVYDEAGYLVAAVNFSDLLENGPSDPSDPPAEEPGVMRSG